jgi:hypothetical protein
MEPPVPRARVGRRPIDAAMLALSALAPACLVAVHLANGVDAAHDPGVARVLGLHAQAWGAIDVPIGLLLMPLPVGTLAARAAMGGALALAGAGATLYVVARRLLALCADAVVLGPVVACIATLSALTAPMWQLEAATTGGSVTGGLLALLPLALLARSPLAPRWAHVGLACGVAGSQGPLVGLCALAGCAAFVAASPPLRSVGGVPWRVLMGSSLLGFAPLFLAIARTRASGGPMFSALLEAWAGERGPSTAGSGFVSMGAEIGEVTALLAFAGLALALLVPGARPLAAALTAVAAVGTASAWAGAPVGPTRYGPPLLAAMSALCALAGVAMQAIVRAVAIARVPLARWSAAMVVALALVLPVYGAEESLARSPPRTRAATATWDAVVWAPLPPRAVVLVTDPRVRARALAARALGSLRSDVVVVGAIPGATATRRALASDPALLPVWRDFELRGMPSEESLSLVAAVRPVLMAYEPRWGRSLAAHLVPFTLLDRFAPEPRGTSDRRRGLDGFAAQRERLARSVADDPALAETTADLLGARALGMATNSDRELAKRVLDDLRALAPNSR